jgi:V/A-type H+/Na+-transporting ATPase subunit E
MDLQLKELLETIKKEGVDAADVQAAAIIIEAESKAKTIIEKAEQSAAWIIENSRSQAQQFERTSKDALVQAGRDLLLSLEKRITVVFDDLMAAGVKEAFSGKVLEEAIVEIVRSWGGGRADALEALLSKEDVERIEQVCMGGLADLLKRGLVLKPVPRIDAGFRIGEKDGSVYYDFTADGLAKILSEYLNPRLGEIIRKAARRES